MQVLGHEKIGTGAVNIIVMIDWISDTSSWDSAKPYLGLEEFTWVFAELNFVSGARPKRWGDAASGGAGSQWAVRSWPRRSGLKWITTTIAIATAAATTASA